MTDATAGRSAASSFQPISPFQKVLGIRALWPIVALVMLLAFNAVFTEGFFRISIVNDRLYGSLIDVLANGAPIAVLALGMTLVIATGGVDLSVGSVMAISAVIAAKLVVPPSENATVVGGLGWNFWPAMGVAVAAAAVIGAFNGVLVSVVRIQPIIATLIVMVAGRGIAQLVADGQKVNFGGNAAYVAFGSGYFLWLPFGATLVLIVLAACAAATRLTGLGLALECVGDSPSASRYVGLRVRVITIAAYVVSAVCAALAGMMFASKTGTADPINDGLNMELYAIFAVVVGGTALTGGRFTLVGSICGALLYQTINTTLLSTRIAGHDVKPAYLPLPVAVVIVVVSLLQSQKFRDAVLRPFRRRSA